MRILIELPTWLGDTVMATPAIENLINFHKQSEFIIVGTKIAVEIFKKHPETVRKREEIELMNCLASGGGPKLS